MDLFFFLYTLNITSNVFYADKCDSNGCIIYKNSTFCLKQTFFTDISAEIATYIWIQILKRPISRWVEYTKNSVFFTTLKI